MELAEQGARAFAHSPASVPAGCGPVGEGAVKIRRRTGRARLDRNVDPVTRRSATGASRQIVRSPEAAKPGPRELKRELESLLARYPAEADGAWWACETELIRAGEEARDGSS